MGKILADKIVLVTGAAVRIGRVRAEVFAREGAILELTAILDAQGEDIAQFVRKQGTS